MVPCAVWCLTWRGIAVTLVEALLQACATATGSSPSFFVPPVHAGLNTQACCTVHSVARRRLCRAAACRAGLLDVAAATHPNMLCGRTDYHVAPEDMLRLGLAVCLPSPLQFYSVSLRSNPQKPITSGLDPHVTIGPSSVSQVCERSVTGYGSAVSRTISNRARPVRKVDAAASLSPPPPLPSPPVCAAPLLPPPPLPSHQLLQIRAASTVST